MNQNIEVWKRKKWVLWYGTFGLALLLLLDGVICFPLFPIGLFTSFGIIKSSTSENTRHTLIVVGWVMYGGLTILASKAKSRAGYFALYGFLCVALVLNVVGCRTVLNELTDLH